MKTKEEKEITRKIWYEKNKERINKRKREYIKEYTEKNKEKVKTYQKDYHIKNKVGLNKKSIAYKQNKRNNDPLFRFLDNLRKMIGNAYRNNGYSKKSKTYKILGCSYDEYVKHIESKWESWMTWDNYGLYNGEPNYGWDIDHIIPLRPQNNERTEDDIIRLNHYTNLRPLCSYVNRYIKKNN